MKIKYQLSVDAENDLREIISYTLENFGRKQALKYTNEVNLCLDKLAEQKSLSKEFKIKTHIIEMLHCKKHYIFALIRPDLPVLIIAIFHERMDLMQRLKERLK